MDEAGPFVPGTTRQMIEHNDGVRLRNERAELTNATPRGHHKTCTEKGNAMPVPQTSSLGWHEMQYARLGQRDACKHS